MTETAHLRPRIIAVDFDGCLCYDIWPEIGRENKDAIKDLIWMRKHGTRVILWTCRCGDMLQKALDWCGERGLYFDAVNENLPEIVEEFGGDTRKIYADEYWDDKAIRVWA